MPSSVPVRILLVDDDPGQARLAQRVLERVGYVVTYARDGKEGIALYNGAAYDLLIVDYHMPDIGGLEVLRLLAAAGELPPSIMVTGHGDEAIAVQALQMGIGDYLVKDVDGGYLHLLPAVVERVLHQHCLLQEKRQAEADLKQAHDELELRVQERTAELQRVNEHLQAEIVERERIEEALAQEHLFVSAVLDTIGALVVVFDTQGHIIRFNRACERTTGYTPDEVKGRRIWDLFLMPSEIGRVKAVYHALRQGVPQSTHENFWRTKSGQPRLIAWSNTVLLDKAGEVEYIISMGIDISERKQTELALAESEARTRAILEAAVEGIITIDEQGRIESFNATAERMFGYTAAEVLGQNITVLMPEPYRREHDGYLARYLRTGEKRIIGIGREVVAQRKDGSTFPMDLAVSEVFLHHRRVFTGFVRDITERQRAEHEMQRADRLALVGQLTSGLAHEIGTPLNVIAGNAELLHAELQEQGLPSTQLETIVAQADRITRLIERLLSFARAKERPAEPLSLHLPLANVLHLLESRFRREAITILVNMPAELPLVWGRADQIEQVFLNVLVNAWHAMPQGGTVTIEAHTTANRQVQITFQDTGCGMARGVLERAFEPFFSTKGDHGTGLGLAICKQIIDSYRGTIHLQSEPGKGTVVMIQLPQADTMAPEPFGTR